MSFRRTRCQPMERKTSSVPVPQLSVIAAEIGRGPYDPMLLREFARARELADTFGVLQLVKDPKVAKELEPAWRRLLAEIGPSTLEKIAPMLALRPPLSTLNPERAESPQPSEVVRRGRGRPKKQGDERYLAKVEELRRRQPELEPRAAVESIVTEADATRESVLRASIVRRITNAVKHRDKIRGR